MQPSLPPVQHVALAMASLRKCRLKETPPPDCTLQMPWTGSLPSAAALSQGERRSLPLATQLHSGSARWALSPSKRQCFSQSFFSILSPNSAGALSTHFSLPSRRGPVQQVYSQSSDHSILVSYPQCHHSTMIAVARDVK